MLNEDEFLKLIYCIFPHLSIIAMKSLFLAVSERGAEVSASEYSLGTGRESAAELEIFKWLVGRE